MKKIFLFFSALFFYISTSAQSDSFYVKGIVMDAKKKAPIQSASVFAQNSTIGTLTDSHGNFTLQLPNGGYDLVITSNGFSTEVKRISSTDTSNSNMRIVLKRKEKALEIIAGCNEVKDGLQQYGGFFRNNFMGKTLSSSECHILNPEVLKFYFNKKRNRLIVLAPAPLLIRNDALGYKIKYTLEYFTYDYFTRTTSLNGYPLFEEIQPANDNQQQKWKLNRREAYRGSVLHFMKSVYNQTLADEGFEIQFVVTNFGVDTVIKLKDFYSALNYSKNDSTQIVEIKPGQQEIAVIYGNESPEQNFLAEESYAPKDYELSIISIIYPVTIEANGYYYEHNDIIISGYWTWEKVGDIIPYDYVPD